VLSFLFRGIVIENALAAIIAAIVLGLINATLKPILQIIALPSTFLTLGIFYLVVNGLLLMLVSALVPGFHISGFGTAFFASIVLSILNAVFIKKDEL
jgi:putative membrane protein